MNITRSPIDNAVLEWIFEHALWNSCSRIIFNWRGFENCAVLVYYAACSGYSLPTFRDDLLVPSFKGKK